MKKNRRKKNKYRGGLTGAFLICIFSFFCISFLVSGILYAGAVTEKRLSGAEKEYISFEDIKNTCTKLYNMLK